MFKKLKTSYELVKVSLMFIKRDGELLTYSIFSLLSSLAILVTFSGLGFFYIGDIEAIAEQSDVVLYAFIFLYYLTFSFITFFFNTAIITSVQRRIEGKDNKFGDGMRDASKHLKEIFIWSLVNATVSTILKILQDRFGQNSVVGRIIISIVGGMWNILTFFSFPLMIVNGMGPKEAIKESGNLFKKTWGERAIIHVGVGLLFGLVFLLIFILSLGLIFTGMIISGIVFIILGILILVIISTTCDVIIKTILLHYAQTGNLPDGLENNSSITNITKEL